METVVVRMAERTVHAVVAGDANALALVPENRPEVRSVPLTDVAMSDDALSFSGYAAVFDTIADLGDFTEEVRRGAYRKVLAQGANVPMYWDHDDRMPPLATTRGGTLRLSEDATGLRVEADLDNDHYMTPTLRSMIRRGDVSGLSFGFVAGRGNQIIEVRTGRPHRILTGFRALLDVSPTWNPAYEGTSVEMRSALAEIRKARLEDGQQVVSGEYQQVDDGAESDGTETGEQEATVEVVEERDSGVGEPDVQVQLAARRRRLQLMGLTLP
jgi:HK97 family phage prohead protease